MVERCHYQRTLRDVISHHALRAFTKSLKMADGCMATWVHDVKDGAY